MIIYDPRNECYSESLLSRIVRTIRKNTRIDVVSLLLLRNFLLKSYGLTLEAAKTSTEIWTIDGDPEVITMFLLSIDN